MLPDEIGLLRSLTVIDLSMDQISGIFPSELGSWLTYFSNYDNAFMGTVPLELGSLTALTYLNPALNSFTQNVPSEFIS